MIGFKYLHIASLVSMIGFASAANAQLISRPTPPPPPVVSRAPVISAPKTIVAAPTVVTPPTVTPPVVASAASTSFTIGTALMNAVLPFTVVGSSSIAPHLLHVSETISPGQTITVQGGYLTTDSKVYLQLQNNAVTSAVSLQILSASPNLIQAAAPSNMTPGLWKLWVQENGQTSNSLMVNQARGVTYDTPEVAPGGAFRVFGRNMVVSGVTASVLFINASDNPSNLASLPTGVTTYAGTVTGGNTYELDATAPSTLTPGNAYQVFVSNGYGSSASLSGYNQVAQTLAIRTQGTDPLGLGVAWGSDFTFASNVYNIKTDPRLQYHAVGDGVTDDSNAIRQAVYQASNSGGGVVYLPAATYLSTGSNIQFVSNVVLKGDGPGQTIINYSSVNGLGYTQGSSKFGLMNMTISNLASSSSSSQNVIVGLNNYTGTVQKEVFFNNIISNSGISGGGASFFVQNMDRVLIENSTFNALGATFWITSDSNVTFRNNTINYRYGRIPIDGCQNAIVENNHFTLDGNYNVGSVLDAYHAALPDILTNIESGGAELSGSTDVIVLNNIFEESGTPGAGTNDGETILTQSTNPNLFKTVGTLTGSSGLTLTDSGASFPTPFPTSDALAVFIVSGPGLGQWRNITGHTASTLTIDRAWDIQPPTGSTYAVNVITANELYALSNTIRNNVGALEIYSGGLDSVVANNNLTDSKGIFLSGWEASNGTAPQIQSIDPLWNIYVANNTVTSTEASPLTAGGYFEITLYQAFPQLFGAGVLNVEVRNNAISCSISCSSVTQNAQSLQYSQYGFENMHATATSYAALDYSTAGMLGSVFEGNATHNLTNYGFFDSPDNRQTVINTTAGMTNGTP